MNSAPEESDLPLINQIPPTSVASPSELRPRNAGELRWYKPTLAETIQLMGWRCIYFAPAVVLLALGAISLRYIWLLPLLAVWWKLLLVAVVLPGSYAVKSAAHIIRQRKDPFCIHCGYDLSGLADNHSCPECGERYTFRAVEEYRRDPAWFIHRYEMKGDLPVSDEPFQALPPKRPRSRDGT